MNQARYGSIMYRTFATIVCALILLFPEFSFATKIKSSWKNPSATGSSLQFTKVLVIVTIKQELIRKVAEDKAVRIIEEGGRATAVPSYSILGLEELSNKDLAKSKVEGMGFDGVIVMRYASVEDTKKYDHRQDWDDYMYFWGLNYPVWGAVYNSTTRDDVKLYIETMFFSLKEQKLIWAGISETKNPKNPAKIVGEIAEETTKHLRKEGLLTAK
jgi:hypothetical protein